MLTLDVEKTGGVAIVRCVGRLVRGEAVHILRNAVVSQRETRIVMLDLSEVEAMDAGGLAVLVRLNLWAHTYGVQLKLANPSAFVLEMLRLMGLNLVFDISCLDDALVVMCGHDHRPRVQQQPSLALA